MIGKVVIGMLWSSSSEDEIFLGRTGITPVGRGHRIAPNTSHYTPVNSIPPWMTYECPGDVDVVIFFSD